MDDPAKAYTLYISPVGLAENSCAQDTWKQRKIGQSEEKNGILEAYGNGRVFCFSQFSVEAITDIFHISKLRFRELSNLTSAAPAGK